MPMMNPFKKKPEAPVVSNDERLRDGAYLEIDVAFLGDASPEASERLAKAKMVVLRAARVELSSSEQVQRLKDAVASMAASPEAVGLDQAQLGFLAFRRIFEKGLDAFSKKK